MGTTAEIILKKPTGEIFIDIKYKKIKEDIIDILKDKLFKKVNNSIDNNFRLSKLESDTLLETVSKLMTKKFNLRDRKPLDEYYFQGIIEIYNLLLLREENDILDIWIV